jgi:hypothetical protein
MALDISSRPEKAFIKFPVIWNGDTQLPPLIPQ